MDSHSRDYCRWLRDYTKWHASSTVSILPHTELPGSEMAMFIRVWRKCSFVVGWMIIQARCLRAMRIKPGNDPYSHIHHFHVLLKLEHTIEHTYTINGPHQKNQEGYKDSWSLYSFVLVFFHSIIVSFILACEFLVYLCILFTLVFIFICIICAPLIKHYNVQHL